MLSAPVARRILNTRDEHIFDLTSSFYELEPFNSIFEALSFKQIRRRLPSCIRKTLHNRFMLPNMLYLSYAIGLLIVDFNEDLNPSPNNTCTPHVSCDSLSNKTCASILDQPIDNNPLANRIYVVLAIINLITGFIYCWAWHHRSFLDIVMIPEYFNIIQAVFYLWSSTWYSKQETLGGYYTMAVHKIELVAAVLGVFAAIGWIVSWYMSYTRILGRGYTLDDPDMVSSLTMLINTIIYVIYFAQLLVHPENYEINMLYKVADVIGFVDACFCVFACLRDDDWFWFLPLAGQYGIALGRVQVETKMVPQFGKPPVLLTNICRRRNIQLQDLNYIEVKSRNDIITVPIFAPSLTKSNH